MVINQNVEIVETTIGLLTLGCCKVDTFQITANIPENSKGGDREWLCGQGGQLWSSASPRKGGLLLVSKELLTKFLLMTSTTRCARNPCLGLCDCNCWCCDCDCSSRHTTTSLKITSVSNCSSRRPFTLTLTEEDETPMVLEMSRPLATNCLPIPSCLHRITVKDQTSTLGSVNQVRKRRKE